MKKLLVVIDYQKDFVDGSLGFEKAKTLEDCIYNRIQEYLRQNFKVVFTYDTHYENYLESREGKHLPIPHCYVNTKGHELYGKLQEFVGIRNTIHINKEAFGVAPKDMLKISEEIGEVDEIEMVGVVSNICVISNVCTFQAQYPNAQIIVNSNLCASFDEVLHEKSLSVMEGLQVNVIR